MSDDPFEKWYSQYAMSYSTMGAMRDAFAGGQNSRDAEIATLKARLGYEIERLRNKLVRSLDPTGR